MLRSDKELASALRQALAAPPPQRKTAFVRRYACTRVSTTRLIWRQAAYLRPRVWLVSMLVLGTALVLAKSISATSVWMWSALTPFLAMTMVTENQRSHTFGMAELEMASPFPLKSVLLARMGLLGTAHTLLLALLCGTGAAASHGMSVGRTTVYLLLPYLLTAVLGLELSRHLPGRDTTYLCLGVALVVAFGGAALPELNGNLYRPENFRVWLAALALLGMLGVWELHVSVKQTEELPCN